MQLLLIIAALIAITVAAEALAARMLGPRRMPRLAAAAVCVVTSGLLDVWFHRLMGTWRSIFCSHLQSPPPTLADAVLVALLLVGGVAIGLLASLLPMSSGWRRVLASGVSLLLFVCLYLDAFAAGMCDPGAL